jgi:hypothetical protein
LFEALEVLKNRVQEVVITLDAIETVPPDLPSGTRLLGAQRQDRQWQLLVRDLDEPGRISLSADPMHLDVEIRTPSLEQIFVVCMKTSDETRIDAPSQVSTK